MLPANLLFSENLESTLEQLLKGYAPQQRFICCDSTTATTCLPLISGFDCLRDARQVTIPAGDDHKSVESLSLLWRFFSQEGATRRSVLINVGGGMVSDLGGFAAATFKRGMDVINLPTTILGAVDAAVGGKTGINFNGLKNEVGAFHQPKAVVFYAPFFASLDQANCLSGFAEMLKHGLLSDAAYLNSLFKLDLSQPSAPAFLEAVRRSVEIKHAITSQDPHEKGLRKALNLGHTMGHALESLSHHIQKPVLHGYAVAWGLVCELFLAHRLLGFPSEELSRISAFVKITYGSLPFTCADYPYLLEAMTHDKKNDNKGLNFTLLAGIGDLRLDQTLYLDQTSDKALLEASLDYLRDIMGI
ncbi:MAG: 3-dehydroquinate synthase [Bacteroidales bacterium]|nr:3-dehydroquinate synthase [Bacteroidales bacterium]